jgi:formate-dependent nitrite reductase membrane component NrfD
MILLQASLFPTEFYLVIPHVILAHLCGVHYLFWQIQPRYPHYTTFGKVASWIAFIIIVWLAFYALPIWITIFGVVSKASALAANNFTIALVALLFVGLMILESFITYNHFFRKRQKTFSSSYFFLSVVISIIAFICTFAMFGFLTKDVILTELGHPNYAFLY